MIDENQVTKSWNRLTAMIVPEKREDMTRKLISVFISDEEQHRGMRDEFDYRGMYTLSNLQRYKWWAPVENLFYNFKATKGYLYVFIQSRFPFYQLLHPLEDKHNHPITEIQNQLLIPLPSQKGNKNSVSFKMEESYTKVLFILSENKVPWKALNALCKIESALYADIAQNQQDDIDYLAKNGLDFLIDKYQPIFDNYLDVFAEIILAGKLFAKQYEYLVRQGEGGNISSVKIADNEWLDPQVLKFVYHEIISGVLFTHHRFNVESPKKFYEKLLDHAKEQHGRREARQTLWLEDGKIFSRDESGDDGEEVKPAARLKGFEVALTTSQAQNFDVDTYTISGQARSCQLSPTQNTLGLNPRNKISFSFDLDKSIAFQEGDNELVNLYFSTIHWREVDQNGISTTDKLEGNFILTAKVKNERVKAPISEKLLEMMAKGKVNSGTNTLRPGVFSKLFNFPLIGDIYSFSQLQRAVRHYIDAKLSVNEMED